MKKIQGYKLTIGLNDKNTLKQEISTEKAISIIKQKMESLRKGFSLKEIEGGYEMQNTRYVFEKSVELSIFNIHQKTLFYVCDYIKQVLNQESILITEITEQALFY